MEITQAFSDRAEVQAQVSLTQVYALNKGNTVFVIFQVKVSLEEEKGYYPQF